ncbi:MAG: symmetrical bis(5'-nucleosyl)-tetraphosphatase [Gammaproteobacteria bacterium]
MATYAIGDVQGCFDELQALLDKIGFDRATDRLWFCGDLVNRGPKSLEVLRFVRDLGPRAATVLGNHDLHLVAVARDPGCTNPKDTLTPVLEAPDCGELIHWLREQPLVHHDAELGFTMVHAGLVPQWDLHTALRCSAELEATLQSDDYGGFLDHMYGNQPRAWSDDLRGWARLRFITNCCTRLRYCDEEGHLALKAKGPPGSQPPGYRPWFEIPRRASRGLRIVFGHWSTLGSTDAAGVFPLDTGCVWGGALTALRLDGKPQWISLPCRGNAEPGRH